MRWLVTLAVAATLLSARGASAEVQHPIPGAGNWVLLDHLPGLPESACSARIRDPDADVILLATHGGRPVLLLGRSDWNLDGPVVAEISIDGGPPQELRGEMALTVMMFGPPDPALITALRGAHVVDWTIGKARYRTDVTGLGTALDAMAPCAKLERKEPAGTSPAGG